MLGERQKAREPGARMSRWCRRWNLLERMQRYPELGMECLCGSLGSIPALQKEQTNKQTKQKRWGWVGWGIGFL